jgi:hypothetical protein
MRFQYMHKISPPNAHILMQQETRQSNIAESRKLVCANASGSKARIAAAKKIVQQAVKFGDYANFNSVLSRINLFSVYVFNAP